MAIKIPAPALWDQDDNFLNNALVQADGLSVVVGTVLKPTRVYPPTATPTLQSCLQIKDPVFNTLYLNMTLAAWQAAIRQASAGSGAGGTPQVILLTVSGTPTTITDSRLSGATLLSVWRNGIEVLSDNAAETVTLSGDTLTFPSALGNGDTVGVLYVIA